jgi:S-DNA-T family DNA segregation ATPase FtsK/SpoIIIE
VSARAGAGAGPLLAVGPGGDEGGVLTVDLRRTGGLLVVGPPGSGRSAALGAFAADLRAQGVAVARVGRAPGAAGAELDAGDPATLEAWLAALAGRPAALVADDVGPAADWPVLAAPTAGHPASVAVLAAGTAADLAGHFQGPLAALRRSRSGLLLRPGPAEADLLGVRLPRTSVPVRPGSGWLVAAGIPARVQVARRRG